MGVVCFKTPNLMQCNALFIMFWMIGKSVYNSSEQKAPGLLFRQDYARIK